MTGENLQESGNLQLGEEDATNPAAKSGKRGNVANLTNKGKGRKPGAKNRNTELKEAVLKAFDKVGGYKYLVRIANGTASDRAAFINLVGKVMPKEVNGTINHNVIPQLPWLSQRMVDKVNPLDAESLGTAGKSLTHQDVVEGEIVQRVDGVPMGHPAQTDGGHDE